MRVYTDQHAENTLKIFRGAAPLECNEVFSVEKAALQVGGGVNAVCSEENAACSALFSACWRQ
jgi:hypothetical protein